MNTIILDHSKLRGRIKEVCGTERKFAKQIGRSNPFVSSVFNNKSYFTLVDICKIKDLLNIQNDEVTVFFLKTKSTKEDFAQKGGNQDKSESSRSSKQRNYSNSRLCYREYRQDNG